MTAPRVLLVARTFPPQVGGMEKYARDLYRSLRDTIEVQLLANTRGKPYLPWFLIRSFQYIAVSGRKFTHIHFCDGVLAPLALAASRVTRARISITIHGLEVVYRRYLYQWIVPACLRRLDTLVCVSRHTLELCVRAGVRRERCIRIPNGILFEDLDQAGPSTLTLPAAHADESDAGVLLVSVTRLIPRKGILWFVSEVMPRLPQKYRYVVGGDGPELDRISAAVASQGLGRRVRLLGRISEQEKLALLRDADLYIMPNVAVPGDVEGFGISILEAGALGVPAVAARLEGIGDAVIEGETGLLVEPADSRGFAAAIEQADFDHAAVLAAVRRNFDWGALREKYLSLFSTPVA